MNSLALNAPAPANDLESLVDASQGEHPRNVVRDVAARPRSAGHIIVFANEKGGVGKSTLAFHCCVALADRGYRVAALDLDGRQRTLSRSLDNRRATARTLGIDLPSPRHTVMSHQSGGMLCQEIGRIGSQGDFVVIDAPGRDSPLGRRAIALADTLVTPINNSFIDLDLIGQLQADYRSVREPGCFTRMVNALREERERIGRRPIDWVVVPNRGRRARSQNQLRFETALEILAANCGFRIGGGMAERVAYRELFPLGLTHLDFARIPGVTRSNGQARRELLDMIEDLALPEAPLLTLMTARR